MKFIIKVLFVKTFGPKVHEIKRTHDTMDSQINDKNIFRLILTQTAF